MAQTDKALQNDWSTSSIFFKCASSTVICDVYVLQAGIQRSARYCATDTGTNIDNLNIQSQAVSFKQRETYRQLMDSC